MTIPDRTIRSAAPALTPAEVRQTALGPGVLAIARMRARKHGISYPLTCPDCSGEGKIRDLDLVEKVCATCKGLTVIGRGDNPDVEFRALIKATPSVYDGVVKGLSRR